MKILWVVIGSLLSGCVSQNSPTLQPVRQDGPCDAGARLLGNPWATPAQQAVAIEIMRNRGCLR